MDTQCTEARPENLRDKKQCKDTQNVLISPQAWLPSQQWGSCTGFLPGPPQSLCKSPHAPDLANTELFPQETPQSPTWTVEEQNGFITRDVSTAWLPSLLQNVMEIQLWTACTSLINSNKHSLLFRLFEVVLVWKKLAVSVYYAQTKHTLATL